MTPITLTEYAKKHFAKLLEYNNNQIVFFGVKKSGCAGFAYNLKTIDKKEIINSKLGEVNGQFYNVNGIPFFITDDAIPTINNTEIDYKKEGLNYIVKFNNPNVQNSCGCGVSFNVRAIH